MEKKGTNFIFETNGQCFLCLHKIAPPIPPDKIELKSLRPIQCLSRYLKLDMRNVFNGDGPNGDGPISPHLLAKVQKSKLKVELCEECITINDKFSELNLQLEKIKMGIKTWLQLILAKLNNDGKFSETDNLQPMTELEKSFLQRKLEIVEAMRKETMQRCSIKLNKLFPRVRIQKLSKRQENEARRIRTKNKELSHQKDSRITEMSVPHKTNLQLHPSIKLEQVTANSLSGSDYGEDNDLGNLSELDSTGTSDDGPCDLPESQTKTERKDDVTYNGRLAGDKQIFSAGPPKSFRQTEGSLREKCTINPKTNKHTCRDCSRIFPSFPAFYIHYKAEHLNIRYECSVCKHKFTQIGNFNKHQKVYHKGKAYKCRDCNQIFSLESNLLKHRGSNGCLDRDAVEHTDLAIVRPVKPSMHAGKIQSMCVLNSKTGKYSCTLCKSVLATKNSFRNHYNACHLKVKYKCIPCKREFSDRASYRRHRSSFHKTDNTIKRPPKPAQTGSAPAYRK